MNKLMEIMWVVIFVIIILFIGYSSWSLSRWMNWKLNYESMTNKQIEKVMTEHINKYHDGIKK